MGWWLKHPIWWGSVVGLLGTGLGGLLGALWGAPRPRRLAGLMNGVAGLMIAVSCFDLLPEAYGISAPWGLAGLALGVLAMLGADLLTRRRVRGGRMAQAGLLVGLGIALHNLPEGLAIGSGFADTPALGLTLGVLIALHDVPEGLALAVPLRASGMRMGRVMALALASGLPTGLGAALGVAAGGVSRQMIALCLGLAGGAMLQVTAQEMIPGAGALYTGWDANLMLAVGVGVGSLVTLLV
ncbi:MAG: ZIP family metal transporter [Oscillospiraceae bacterium]|jgi:ZIP family zinc transporter|nr:ZIP family metal transporter [Oscillospiraceae bacterium]